MPFFRLTVPALLLVASVAASTAFAQTERPPAQPHPEAALTPELAEQVEMCAGCHGEDGRPALEESAIIWGQEYYYLYVQLRDFAAGRRESEIMTPIAAELSRDQMKALAQYFSEKEWPRIPFAANEADVAKGRQIAVAGQCPQCHLSGFLGNSRVPRLANQTLAYLEKTMLDLKYRRRRNAPDIAVLLDSFSDEEIAAMAHFLAGL